jgi:hypothetical protein
MAVKLLVHDDRRSLRTDFPWRSRRFARFEALDKSDVAALSASAINGMTCDELVRTIRVANLPDLLCRDLDEHLPFYDDNVLKRLAHLAQRCCRNRGWGGSERMLNRQV